MARGILNYVVNFVSEGLRFWWNPEQEPVGDWILELLARRQLECSKLQHELEELKPMAYGGPGALPRYSGWTAKDFRARVEALQVMQRLPRDLLMDCTELAMLEERVLAALSELEAKA